MNYGLEARVPFLDATVMREMLALPAEWKLKIHERTEKQLLREAFDGMVPFDIIWRGKEQFGDGSGAGDVLAKLVEKEKAKEDAQDAAAPDGRARLGAAQRRGDRLLPDLAPLVLRRPPQRHPRRLRHRVAGERSSVPGHRRPLTPLVEDRTVPGNRAA